MSGDLTKKHLLPGMSKQEMIRLIGEPDGYESGTDSHFRSFSPVPTVVATYRLGGWGIEAAGMNLSVLMDGSGRIQSTYLWGVD